MALRLTITCLAVSSVACFTKPEFPDPSGDGGTQTLRIVNYEQTKTANADSTSLFMRIPPGDALFLLVAAHLGGQCGDTIPAVASILADGTRLTPGRSIAGVPCGSGARSEQWSLVKPQDGNPVQITVNLSAAATTFHVIAIALDGVDQADPIRSSHTEFGNTDNSTITVDSAVGDLIIDTIGQGSSINGPGFEQERVTTQNQSPDFTLDNSASSSKPGSELVRMTWTFGSIDQWQTIATSIRPAP